MEVGDGGEVGVPWLVCEAAGELLDAGAGAS